MRYSLLSVVALSVYTASISLLPAADDKKAPPPAKPQPYEQEVQATTDQLYKGYDADLHVLQDSFQKAGDLDSFLACRDAAARFQKNRNIQPGVPESQPLLLVRLQDDYLDKINRQTQAIAKKYINQLLPQQVELTKKGKIDEAIAVRNKIKAIENTYKGSFAWVAEHKTPKPLPVSALSLIQAYNNLPDLSDKLFKDYPLEVKGTVVKFEQEYSGGNLYNIYLQGEETEKLTVQCTIDTTDLLVEKAKGLKEDAINISRKSAPNQPPLLLKSGSEFTMQGVCQGKHINIKLQPSSIPKEAWPAVPAAPAMTKKA